VRFQVTSKLLWSYAQLDDANDAVIAISVYVEFV